MSWQCSWMLLWITLCIIPFIIFLPIYWDNISHWESFVEDSVAHLNSISQKCGFSLLFYGQVNQACNMHFWGSSFLIVSSMCNLQQTIDFLVKVLIFDSHVKMCQQPAILLCMCNHLPLASPWRSQGTS